MTRVLVLGATSAIAQEVSKLYAKQGAQLVLVARSAERVEAVASDLKVRGASEVKVITGDLAELSGHGALVEQAFSAFGSLDVVLLAYGTLSDQAACERDVTALERELRTNFVSAASLLTLVAERLEREGKGTVAVISSVAGDRGRQSNYVYGAAKAGLTAFTSGLRNRLWKKDVRVVTVKPGFVDTPMTAAVPKNPLFAKPDAVARRIVKAIRKGKPVVYVPGFWRLIMWIIRSIPERVFVRLRL